MTKVDPAVQTRADLLGDALNAMALACLKLSRLVAAPDHQDSWTDLAGYAACGWHTATTEVQP